MIIINDNHVNEINIGCMIKIGPLIRKISSDMNNPLHADLLNGRTQHITFNHSFYLQTPYVFSSM